MSRRSLAYSGAVSLRAEVQLVREALEGALAPSVATRVLFDALDRSGRGVPSSAEEVLELVRGPLAEILEHRLGIDAAEEIVRSIEARVGALAAELEVDVELEEEDESRTSQMAAVPYPVSVVVVSTSDELAARLLAAVGEVRVHPHTASDEQSFRHATFSVTPLLAIVDCAAPAIGARELTAALRGLPDRTLAVVWGEETSYGRELRARLESAGARALFLDRAEGNGPLLDLVLSRFKRASSMPPPR